MKETDLFDPVRSFFEDSGYTVHSEVQFGFVGKRADLVATHGNVIAVAELKTSLSLDLIEQAVRWKGFANAIYIGVPKRKYHISGYVAKLLHQEGIGTLEVEHIDDSLGERWNVTCHNRPHTQRKILPKLWGALTEQNLADNHIKGGTRGGGYSTPYKRTIEKIRDIMRDDWQSTTDILKRMEFDTHWAAPKSSMSQALRSFEADWCECQKIDGRLMFRRKQKQTG